MAGRAPVRWYAGPLAALSIVLRMVCVFLAARAVMSHEWGVAAINVVLVIVLGRLFRYWLSRTVGGRLAAEFVARFERESRERNVR